MPKNNQEFAARRFDIENTPPRYDAGYECKLPPEVRSEFVAPRRPRILGRQNPATIQPGARRALYLALLISALVLGGAATALWRQSKILESLKSKDTSQYKQSRSLQRPCPRPLPVLQRARGKSLWRSIVNNFRIGTRHHAQLL